MNIEKYGVRFNTPPPNLSNVGGSGKRKRCSAPNYFIHQPPQNFLKVNDEKTQLTLFLCFLFCHLGLASKENMEKVEYRINKGGEGRLRKFEKNRKSF